MSANPFEKLLNLKNQVQNNQDDYERVLERVRANFASEFDARKWMDAEPLSGWGSMTAKDLIVAGRVDDVFAYIEAAEMGLHA